MIHLSKDCNADKATDFIWWLKLYFFIETKNLFEISWAENFIEEASWWIPLDLDGHQKLSFNPNRLVKFWNDYNFLFPFYAEIYDTMTFF